VGLTTCLGTNNKYKQKKMNILDRLNTTVFVITFKYFSLEPSYAEIYLPKFMYFQNV